MADPATYWNFFLPYVPIVIIVLLTVVVAWLASLLMGRLMRRSTQPVAAAARRLAEVAVGLIGATLALQAIGLNTAILLLAIGLLGVTVLVALREPLGNYGAKFFSDIYTPFRVGDTIQVQGVSGKVIEINAMTTVLLSDNAQLISVPNLAMIRDIVVNTSPRAWKEVTLPVSISGSIDLPAFESELLKSLSKLKVRLDPRFPPVLATQARSPQSTDLTLTLMLRRPEDRGSITLEVNKRLSEVLEGLRGGRR
ncbi:MAG TPA: mechanosensitive ion channel domain-containing protein [Thermoplasmata archaeon]|nr:mechanosensitive ion channel domain-containing protein [Thermoplasmata archaeon]